MGAEHRDLTIENVLNDPMIRAANKADHISLQDFERLLRATAQDLKSERGGRLTALTASPTSRNRCGDWSACFA
jgi:hypothetical protein